MRPRLRHHVRAAMTELRSPDELVAFIRSHGPYDLSVWDFDGVICDSEPFHAEAYRTVLLETGVQPGDDFFGQYVGLTEPEIWDGLAARHGIPTAQPELIRRRLEALRPRLLTAPPSWFVRPALAALDEDGTPSVLVSSGNAEVVAAYLAAWGLARAFREVSALTPGAAPKRVRLGDLLRSTRGRTLLFEDVEAYLALGRAHGAVTIGARHAFSAPSLPSADAIVLAGPEAVEPGTPSA